MSSVMAHSEAPEQVARILERCSELSTLTDEPGGVTRGFLSPSMEKATTLVAGWMQQAGLETELDAAGNLVGSRPGTTAEAPILVLGSHLDTVRDAGHYDGVLGVLLAIAAVDGLGEKALPFDLEIIAFADEEGLRFGAPFLGSKALIGELEPHLLERCDGQGTTMEQAIRSWGGDPAAIRCRYRDRLRQGRRLLGYFEAHIEQGPQLEHSELPLGVLEALCASCWLRLRFHGRAGHAGTTPMKLRRDPMPAAAEMALAAERLAEVDGAMVATVGQLTPSPGASNVIPGSVEMSLDLRHPDGQRLQNSIELLLEAGEDIARRRGLVFEHEILHHQAGVTADPELSRVLAEAVDATGHTLERLVIGAGHDALIMARRMPVTMLFLRSPGGISHHPDEAVLPEDVGAALEVMENFVHRLAEHERSTDTRAPIGTLPATAGTASSASLRAAETTPAQPEVES